MGKYYLQTPDNVANGKTVWYGTVKTVDWQHQTIVAKMRSGAEDTTFSFKNLDESVKLELIPGVYVAVSKTSLTMSIADKPSMTGHEDVVVCTHKYIYLTKPINTIGTDDVWKAVVVSIHENSQSVFVSLDPSDPDSPRDEFTYKHLRDRSGLKVGGMVEVWHPKSPWNVTSGVKAGDDLVYRVL